MTYFAKSNIKHNGVSYSKGEEVEISDEQAEALLKDGILTTENETGEVGESDTPVVDQETSGVSGPTESKTKTGEPVLDGDAVVNSDTEATDVTENVVSEKETTENETEEVEENLGDKFEGGESNDELEPEINL